MKSRIAIIGLGYVGLPLAMEFAKKYKVIGFDINERRISELKKHCDVTNEINFNEFKIIPEFTSDPSDIQDSNVFIVTVPTPVTEEKKPDLAPLQRASELVGSVLKPDDVVIYESTVYPGCTEEICLPILSERSGLNYNENFFVGYSPERINPGDPVRKLSSIPKVTSGSNEWTRSFVDDLYKSIIDAGTFSAASIKVAEASKILENCQRDVNIGFINSLVPLFDKVGVSLTDSIHAASTKWNFIPYTPGLVGGHCISVDPYYLMHLGDKSGIGLTMIEAARDANEKLASAVAEKLAKMLLASRRSPTDVKTIVYGATFKEDCPDIRNSKSFDLYSCLVNDWYFQAEIVDPVADSEEVALEHGLSIRKDIPSDVDVIIVASPHKELMLELIRLMKNRQHLLIFDIKGTLSEQIDHEIVTYYKF